jgi:hypothetical protein
MIAVVVFELIVCLVAWAAIGVGNADDDGQAAFPLEVWLACAIVQLTIYYLPPGRPARYRLWLLVALMLLASAIPGRLEPLSSFFHQALFIAGVAALPLLWWEWFAKTPKDRAAGLAPIGSISPPLGFVAWSLANIGIVKFEAWRGGHGEPYCILVPDGGSDLIGYHQAPDDWSLGGLRMVTGRGSGGSGHCCQWGFHALLLTHNDQLSNWSYRSQRFERVSERARRDIMGLSRLTCRSDAQRSER